MINRIFRMMTILGELLDFSINHFSLLVSNFDNIVDDGMIVARQTLVVDYLKISLGFVFGDQKPPRIIVRAVFKKWDFASRSGQDRWLLQSPGSGSPLEVSLTGCGRGT